MGKLVYFSMSCVICALVLVVCSKPSSNGENTDDSTPPNTITDLSVVNVTSNSITLQWTAPGDDDTLGYATEYDLRVSFDSITTVNFSQAYRITGELNPAPARFIQQHIVDMLEPDSTYYFAIKARDDADNWSGLSNCTHGHCPAIATVAFPDSALERVIRQYIHKPTGPILSSDVDTVTQVDAPGQGIGDITGLEYFTSLRILMIPSNNINDISPLSYLHQLGELDITFNHISDLTPLTGHESIYLLHIGENPINNISALSSITALRQFWLYETQVTDFSPLYNLPHLEDIHFASCNLSDLGFMAHLTHVKIAQLSSNHFTSVAPLAGDTALVGLGLDFSDISDLTPLTGLHNLNSLSLHSNNVSDIQPLVDNPGIASGDIIYLNNNPLSQVSIDSLIPALEARGVTVIR